MSCGINVDRLFMVAFFIGSALAGLGGALSINLRRARVRPSRRTSGLRADRRDARRPRLDEGRAGRRAAARDRRRRRQVLRPADRPVHHLRADDLRCCCGGRRDYWPEDDPTLERGAHARLRSTSRWRWEEIAFWVLAAASIVVFPTHLVLIAQVLITGLFALSFDLLVGYAGIPSLGHAAFFGFGAYTAGLSSARRLDRADQRPVARAGSSPGCSVWLLSVVVSRLTRDRADHDHARRRTSCSTRRPTARADHRRRRRALGDQHRADLRALPVRLSTATPRSSTRSSSCFLLYLVAPAHRELAVRARAQGDARERAARPGHRRLAAQPLHGRRSRSRRSLAGVAGALLAQITQTVALQRRWASTARLRC